MSWTNNCRARSLRSSRAFVSKLHIFGNISSTIMPNVQYDSHSKPLYVQAPVKEYENLSADTEELADITAYKKAKKKAGKTVPFDEAFREVEDYHREQASWYIIILLLQSTPFGH